MNKILILIIAAACVCCISCHSNTQNTIDVSSLRGPLSIVANIKSTQEQLYQAVQNLDNVKESPLFWTTIASDLSYKEEHRRLCVYELFVRHVAVRMSLFDLSKILDSPNWLKRDDIDVVGPVYDHIPVGKLPGNTVVVIRIFPQLAGDVWGVYLRVSGSLSKDQIIRIIMDRKLKGFPAQWDPKLGIHVT